MGEVSLSAGDHVPRSGLKNWGIHRVAELGTHWVGLPSVGFAKEGVRASVGASFFPLINTPFPSSIAQRRRINGVGAERPDN